MSDHYFREPYTAKDYLKTIALGILVTGLAILVQKYVEEGQVRPLFSLLSNGFLAAGALLFGGGVLSWVKKDGLFNIFSFGFGQAFRSVSTTFNPTYEKRDRDDYFSYQQRKAIERRTNIPWLVVGLGFLLLAILFTFLFYQFP